MNSDCSDWRRKWMANVTRHWIQLASYVSISHVLNCSFYFRYCSNVSTREWPSARWHPRLAGSSEGMGARPAPWGAHAQWAQWAQPTLATFLLLLNSGAETSLRWPQLCSVALQTIHRFSQSVFTTTTSRGLLPEPIAADWSFAALIVTSSRGLAILWQVFQLFFGWVSAEKHKCWKYSKLSP